jgi:hypothetical protein
VIWREWDSGTVRVLNRKRLPDVMTAPQILPQALSGNRAFFFDSACAIVAGAAD